MGLIDWELNGLTKALFLATVVLSVILVCLKGFDGPWYIYIFRFILLFSYLVPISLRVNLDMGKIFYSYAIGRDKEIPGTQARSTTIPEELGRINYLMSDKTGTLTMNQMIFKKLHLGTVGYTDDTFDEVVSSVAAEYRDGKVPSSRTRTRVTEAVLALALCHNVTPVYEAEEGAGRRARCRRRTGPSTRRSPTRPAARTRWRWWSGRAGRGCGWRPAP